MRVSDLARALSPIRARLANMLARAVVSLVDDGTGIQTVQVSVLDGETRGDLERFQNFGFTSRPSAGAEAAVLFVGGHRDHGIVVAVDDRRYRVTGLEEGAACVYDAGGSKVTLHNDGSMDLEASSGATLTLTATGGVEVTPAAGQSIVLAGGVLAVARATDPIQGTAGPYPIAGVIAPTAGALQVKG
jgi:phage baseplate assembly protein V